MSALQDFGYLSERRRAGRQQRRRRMLTVVATVSAILVLAVVGAAGEVKPTEDGSVSPTSMDQQAGAAPESDASPPQSNDAAAAPESDASPPQSNDAAAGPESDASPPQSNDAAAGPESDASPPQSNDAAAGPGSDASPPQSNDAAAGPESDASPPQSNDAAAGPESDASPPQSNNAAAGPESDASPPQSNDAAAGPESDASPPQSNDAAAGPESDASPPQSNDVAAGPESDASPPQSNDAAAAPESDASPPQSNDAAAAPEGDASPSQSNDAAAAPESSNKKSSIGVSLICAPTDYQDTCESTLNSAVNESASTKDIVRSAVTVVVDAVTKAFEHADNMKSDDPSIKGAVEVCRHVHSLAVSDLNKTLSAIDAYDIKQLPKQVYDLRTWISAAAAYQDTCIDSYPDGEMKTQMKTAMKTAREVTSNALAIVGSLSSLLSVLRFGGKRRLLDTEEPAQPDLNDEHLPSWIDENDHRALLSKASTRFTPNVTVAKDGSGDFKTINDALAKIPDKYDGVYVIRVKQGVYDEQVMVSKKMVNVTFYGDGSRKSVITGKKNFVDGVKTFYTATVAVEGDGFMAVAMGFENTAGPEKGQAVALRVNADRAIFLNCRMEGYQDTLYAHSNRQFYRGCFISGTVDFVFGDSSTIFQNCILSVRNRPGKQKNVVLAQGRGLPKESNAFVLQNCKFVPEKGLNSEIQSYLGRPWKEYSTTIIMESEIGAFIEPEGYLPWSGDFALKTLSYSEYGNTGPGADTSKRVTWPGIKFLSADEAEKFTAVPFIQGDGWITKTGVPVKLGLFKQ